MTPPLPSLLRPLRLTAAGLFASLALTLLPSQPSPAGRVAIDEPLRDKTTGLIDGAGRFVPEGGWQSSGGLLILDAGRAIEHGSFEAIVHGAQFPAKGADKSSMFSGWESATFNPGTEPGSFWHWRTGSQDVLKPLAAPDGALTRLERGLGAEVYRKLNDGKPHRFGVAWENGRVAFSVDGEVLHTFQFHRFSIRYITIGKELGGAGAQLTDPAPIVSDVKVMDYTTPEPTEPAIAAEIAQRTPFEQSFEHHGTWENPYREVTATVVLERLRGAGPVRLPLFWDGGKIWRFRFAPNAPGRWTWRIESNDPGLHGRTGAFRCTASNEPGGVIATPIEFRYEKAREFWPMGDLNWSAFARHEPSGLDRGSFERFLDVRAKQRFNLVLADALGLAVNEGGPAFADYGRETLNPGYWQEVERRVREMNRRGIVAFIALAAAAPRGAPANDKSWADFGSHEARLRYAKHVLARLGVYNVAFALAREWSGNDAQAADLDRLGAELAALNSHGRILTVHTAHVTDAGRFASSSWNALASFAQDYDQLHRDTYNRRASGKPRLHGGYGVYLLDRDGDGRPDFHNSTSLDAMRHATWDIAMSHGVFVTAFAPTFDGGRGHAKGFVPDDPAANAWAAQLHHLHTFFHRVMPENNSRGTWHWLRTRDPVADRAADDFLTVPHPRTSDIVVNGVTSPPARAAWKMAKEGFGYGAAIYLRGYTETCRLETFDAKFPEQFRGQEPEPVYSVRLFNPRTGETRVLADHRGRGPIELTPPSAEDWVFAIRRLNPWVPKDYTPTGRRPVASKQQRKE